MLLIVFPEEGGLTQVRTISTLRVSMPFNVVQSQVLILATPAKLISFLCKKHTFHDSDRCHRVSFRHIMRLVYEVDLVSDSENLRS